MGFLSRKNKFKDAVVEETHPIVEELEEMEPSEVKEVAAALGIVLPPRTRATTYIDHILGEVKGDAPAVEVSEPPVTKVIEPDEVTANGDSASVNVDEIVNLVLDQLAKLITQR